ncbi:hypothetical protein TYRP_008479 [Tyrophagus putrescentiae]|nr:hypothetical protein TYRP_008479 [Tyrophagus putrescentiae]
MKLSLPFQLARTVAVVATAAAAGCSPSQRDVSYFKTPENSATQVNALQSGNGRIVTSTFSAMPSPQCIGRDIRSLRHCLAGPGRRCCKEAPGLFKHALAACSRSSWTYERPVGSLFT